MIVLLTDPAAVDELRFARLHQKYRLATGLALVIAAPAQQSATVQYRSSIYVNVPPDKVPASIATLMCIPAGRRARYGQTDRLFDTCGVERNRHQSGCWERLEERRRASGEI